MSTLTLKAIEEAKAAIEALGPPPPVIRYSRFVQDDVFVLDTKYLGGFLPTSDGAQKVAILPYPWDPAG